MLNGLKKILDKNNSTPKKRDRIVATFCTSFALLYHIVIFFVFLHFKIKFMVIFNIFSVSIFTFLIFKLQSKKTKSITPLYIFAAIEVIAHQICSDIILGSYTNFHFFILLMGLLPFLILRTKSRFLIPFAILTSTGFIVLEILQIPTNRYYDLSLFDLNTFRAVNVSLAVVIIIFMILIFTYVVENYDEHLDEKNKTLTNEIEMAAVIQQNFFKQDLTGLEGVEIACYNKPMAGVSGDVFDFYKTKNKLDGFGLFDISGHGISSGLVTMLIKNIINKEFYDHTDLGLWEIMTHINERVIVEKGDIQNYLTGVLVRFVNNDTIELVSAGHPMPIIYHHETGKCELLQQDSTSIGPIGIAGIPVFYNSIFEKLRKNDEIILYSDGITDVMNEYSENFGIDNFIKAIETYGSKSVKEQMENVAGEIDKFHGKQRQNDDLTFIILKNTSSAT